MFTIFSNYSIRATIIFLAFVIFSGYAYAAPTSDRTQHCFAFTDKGGSAGNVQFSCFTVQRECVEEKNKLNLAQYSITSLFNTDCSKNQTSPTGIGGSGIVETSVGAYNSTSNSNINDVPNFSVQGGGDQTVRLETSNKNSGAQGTSSYVPITNLPGLSNVNTTSVGGLSGFLNTIYTMAIGFGAVAAVFFLIYYGLQYATSSSGMTMSVLRNKITMVLGGVMFLIASVALLNIINPNLTGGGGGSLYDFNVAEYDTEAVEFVYAHDQEVTATSTGPRDPLGNNDITTDDFTYNDSNVDAWDNVLGDAANIPDALKVWVPNAQEARVNSSELSATEDECTKRNGGVKCVEISNPVAPAVSGEAPESSIGLLTMSPPPKDRRCDDQKDKSGYYCVHLRDNVASKIGWPANPYRRPADFASHGDKQIKISRTAVEMDRYFQDEFKSKFGITLRLVSAYRDPAHNKCTKKCKGKCCSTSNNHQLGYSLDYGTNELTQEQLNFFQDLIIKSKVVRVGWGSKNDAGTHVQWDDGVNKKWIYWCYTGTNGPFKGPGTISKHWSKGTTCKW